MTDAPKKNNVFAIISCVFGLISVPAVICCYGFPFNVIGLVTGLIALNQIKSDPTQDGATLAKVGIASSCVGFVLIAAVFVFMGGAMGLDALK